MLKSFHFTNIDNLLTFCMGWFSLRIVFTVVVAVAVMLGLYLIWLEVAPTSGIGTPEIISDGVLRGNELLLLLLSLMM